MLFALFTGFRLALRSIARSTLRAGLTILGILIGVAAVVTVTALGAGARDSVGDKIANMGSNVIMIAPQSNASSMRRRLHPRQSALSLPQARTKILRAMPIRHGRQASGSDSRG